MQDNSPITFTRSAIRDSLFSWPTITYHLARRKGGAEIGQLTIRHNKAEYAAADHRDDFRIRRNFWGTKWTYEGDDERLFARVSIGFKQTITFADGSHYRMKLKRRWRLFTRKAVDEYTHLALFFRDETEVARLENLQPLPFFSSEVSAPMSGPVTTGLTETPVIAGLLLLFQSYLVTTRQAAAAG